MPTSRTRHPLARLAARLVATVAGLVVVSTLAVAPAHAETGAMQIPTTGRVTGVMGAYCTSGKAHGGIDVAAPTGTPVRASAAGTVDIAGRQNGSLSYGIFVRVSHDAGYRTIYAHLSKVAVKPGQKVTQGQVIGYVGSTGNSSGPHLHFEVRKDNVRQAGINASFPCRTTVKAGTPIQWAFPGLAR